jgi:CheY-like chemotaxis protein
MGILYLDSKADRAIKKALRMHGRVHHAGDINEALFMMVERDFDFYFVDADTPQALAFLKHLRHDPQLAPPRAVVLLTDNDDEDCEAWSVDTFITRSRIQEDSPYIFSHLNSSPDDRAGVIRIAPRDPREEGNRKRDAVERLSERGRREPDDSSIPPERAGERGDGEMTGQADRSDEVTTFRKRIADEPKPGPEAAKRATRLVSVAAVIVILAVGAWVFIWGPLAGQRRQGRAREPGKSVEAETSRSSPHARDEASLPAADLFGGDLAEGSAPRTTPLTTPETTTPAAAPATESGTTSGHPADAQTPSKPAEAAPAPAPVAPPPVNHPPTAAISGPGQVMQGQTVTFSASATDPDGDSVSLSWTARSMSWSTPGLFSISVTATDARGSSSTSTRSIRVI